MKLILLDRDGTVIRDPEDERVDSEEEIELFPDTLEALSYLADNGFSAVFVTNQAGIAEGRITMQDFERIHAKVIELLAPSGIRILKTYVCPHTPEDLCGCRKPKPTMLLEAMKEFNLSAESTFIIGDRESDVMAGINAGIKAILVETARVPVSSKEAVCTAPTLLEAVKYAASH